MSENPLLFLWADRRARLPYRRYLDLEDRPRRLAAQNFSLLNDEELAIVIGHELAHHAFGHLVRGAGLPAGCRLTCYVKLIGCSGGPVKKSPLSSREQIPMNSFLRV